jgi:hypothetical protein
MSRKLMKRSQVIDIMHMFISEILCTTKEFDKEDCHELLRSIEDCGIVDKDRYEDEEVFGKHYGG